jgi:alkylation response protein AidB-like acyl-CoA dehydrogenase
MATITAAPLQEIAAAAPDVDRAGRFPDEALQALARDGLLALGVPPAWDGPGGGPREAAAAIEQVAGACASAAMVYLMHVVATQTLLAGAHPGSAGAAEGEAGGRGPCGDALRAIAHGEHVTTLAYSERGSRGHFWAQVSRARPDGDAVVIDADKSFATGAGHVDSYVLATGAPGADDPLATELYLVPAGAPGLTIPRRFDGLGLRGNASAPLELRGVRVGLDRRLGAAGSGLGLMLEVTLPWFVIGSAACSVGIAGAALAAATEHATTARFEHLGTTLAQVPGVRARLAQAAIRHAESRALLYQVAGQVADGAPEAQTGVLALKAAAAEMAVEVTDLCLRVGGGAAYAKHGPLERHFRDARAASLMAPTTDLLHDFLGKALCGLDLM